MPIKRNFAIRLFVPECAFSSFPHRQLLEPFQQFGFSSEGYIGLFAPNKCQDAPLVYADYLHPAGAWVTFASPDKGVSVTQASYLFEMHRISQAMQMDIQLADQFDDYMKSMSQPYAAMIATICNDACDCLLQRKLPAGMALASFETDEIGFLLNSGSNSPKIGVLQELAGDGKKNQFVAEAKINQLEFDRQATKSKNNDDCHRDQTDYVSRKEYEDLDFYANAMTVQLKAEKEKTKELSKRLRSRNEGGKNASHESKKNTRIDSTHLWCQVPRTLPFEPKKSIEQLLKEFPPVKRL